MDSPLTSEPGLRLLEVTGASWKIPREWEPGWVEACIPTVLWEEATLTRGAQELPLSLRRIAGKIRVVAEWPRSGPGNYALLLRTPVGTSRLDTSVQPGKLGQGEFSRLLEDLQTRLPASIALGLQRTGGLAGLHLLSPQESTLAAEVLRLRRAVLGTPDRPGLAEVLPEIARDPHRMLHTRELWVRRRYARRPHPARLAQAISRGANLYADRLPVQVVDTRVEDTTDVYENRVVKTFVRQVDFRLRRVARVAAAGGYTELGRNVGALAERLSRSGRIANFLEGVEPLSQVPNRVSMVLLKRPSYRAALEGFLEFQKSLSVQLDERALDAPLENLPFLYQVWGTLHVTDVLLDVAATLGFVIRRERMVSRHGGDAFLQVYPDGRPAVVLAHPATGTVVRLIPERSYGTVGELRSITYSQRPDIAVEIVPAAGPARICLFDPKYKLDGELTESGVPDARPKKVDIDKMHAYRDAIRDEVGRRVVRYAAILYPGPVVSYTDGIEALSARPDTADDLRSRLRVILEEVMQAETFRIS